MPIVPFSEPPYIRGLASPIYKDTHRKWQKLCRAFMEEHLIPYARQYEEQDYVPPSLLQTFVKANMLVPLMATPLPCDILKKEGIHDVLGIPIEEFDSIHSIICQDELCRSGIQGPNAMMASFGSSQDLEFSSAS